MGGLANLFIAFKEAFVQAIYLRSMLLIALLIGLSLVSWGQSFEISGTVIVHASNNNGPTGIGEVLGFHEDTSSLGLIFTNEIAIRGLVCTTNNELIFLTTTRLAEKGHITNSVGISSVAGSEERVVYLDTQADFNFHDILLTPSGDLLMGTGAARGELPEGVWMIRDILGTSPSEPEVLISDNHFSQIDGIFASAIPMFILDSGPFAGDLLFSAYPGSSGSSDAKVFRANGPDFTTISEFIAVDDVVQGPETFRPVAVATNSQEELFVADFWGDRILRFDISGNFQTEFLKVPFPREIEIGSDDLMHVVHLFELSDGTLVSQYSIFDSITGDHIATTDYEGLLLGIEVCEDDLTIETLDEPADSDGDGVPDEDDLCPNFAGSPATDGC